MSLTCCYLLHNINTKQQKMTMNLGLSLSFVKYGNKKDDNKHGSLSIVGQQKNQKAVTKLISVFYNTTTKTKGKNDNKPRFIIIFYEICKERRWCQACHCLFLKYIDKTKKRMMMSLNALSSFVETIRRQQWALFIHRVL